MSYFLPKPEKFQGAGSVLPGARIELKPANDDVEAGDPLIYVDAEGSVEAADGAAETDVTWAGVALTDASAGDQVPVVVYGTAAVKKQTGTAWEPGDAIGIGTGTPATIQVQADTATFKMFLGYAAGAALSAADSGFVFVK